MQYFEFEPAPPLASRIACYWGMTVAPDVVPGTPHHLIPDGCISLVASRSRAAILGPRAEPLAVPLQPGEQYWGVRFWPDAGAAYLGMAVTALRGRVLAPVTSPAWAAKLTQALSASSDENQAASVADAILCRVEPAALDGAVRAAVVAIVQSRGEAAIADVARASGLSPRQLERRFNAAVGLTPKQFARIRRMRAALAHLLEPEQRTWSEVAAASGFSDHAHLVRDAVKLAGLPPSELARHVRSIHHRSVKP